MEYDELLDGDDEDTELIQDHVLTNLDPSEGVYKSTKSHVLLFYVPPTNRNNFLLSWQ